MDTGFVICLTVVTTAIWILLFLCIWHGWIVCGSIVCLIMWLISLGSIQDMV